MYLYIFEDGAVGVSYTPPTPDDLAMVEDGYLQVFRSDSKIWGTFPDGKPIDLEQAKVVTEDGQTFHLSGP